MTKANTGMTNYHQKQLMAIIAIILLIPALWITAIWIEVWNSHPEFTGSAKIQHFLEHFPDFVKSTGYIVAVNLICALSALVLAAKSFKQRSVALRILTMVTAMAASLVVVLTIFMMV